MSIFDRLKELEPGKMIYRKHFMSVVNYILKLLVPLGMMKPTIKEIHSLDFSE